MLPLSPHDLAIHAEYSLDQALPTLIGAGATLLLFFIKELITRTVGTQDKLKDESQSESKHVQSQLTDILVKIGVLTEKVRVLEKDLDGVGEKLRKTNK